MLTPTPTLVRLAMPAFLVLALVSLHGVSQVHAKGKPGHRHVFILDRLDLPKEAPAELESLVKTSFLKTVEAKPALLSALPEGTPPVDVNEKGLHGNKPFRKFMRKKKLRAYKVVVQVTSFEQPVTANENKPGNVIGCSVELRIFGETIPDRVMAFSGDGSASVAIEVGKKIRDRDRSYATNEALDLAVAEAISMSLTKLNAKPTKKKKRPKKKK